MNPSRIGQGVKIPSIEGPPIGWRSPVGWQVGKWWYRSEFRRLRRQFDVAGRLLVSVVMSASNIIPLRREAQPPTREQLIVAHVELAKRVARRAASRVPAGAAREEALSAGLLGLVDAADRFDPARGVPFDAFARRRVHGAVLDFLRAEDPLSRDDRKKRRSGQSDAAEPEFVQFEDVAELLGGDAGGFDEDSMIMRAYVRAAVARLPEADQQLLGLYYGEERTLREVGSALGGVTESRICQRLSGILKALRKLLAE